MKIIIILAVVLLGGLGTYAYITRPAPAPSAVVTTTENTNEAVNNTKNENETSSSKISGDVEIRTINMGIISSQSSASFRLNEILRGVPTVVTGTTSTLTGDVGITFAPANIFLGEIKINARTLKTDSEKRDGAIARMILNSEKSENEFITLKNSVVTNLPTVIPIGQKFTFTVVGDLTINGVTKKTSFNSSGTVSADNTFTGGATATINHSDFNIKIPNFDFLANVDKQSVINISFVAK